MASSSRRGRDCWRRHRHRSCNWMSLHLCHHWSCLDLQLLPVDDSLCSNCCHRCHCMTTCRLRCRFDSSATTASCSPSLTFAWRWRTTWTPGSRSSSWWLPAWSSRPSSGTGSWCARTATPSTSKSTHGSRSYGGRPNCRNWKREQSAE